MTSPDRRTLPLTAPEFGGTANRTLRGSEPDWNLIRHPEPPEGAPNVLLVLIDDAGFGNPSTFGGPIQTPNYTRMAEGGLRYNRFHVTALCSPTRAALLTGRNNHAVGFGSVGEFSSGFPGYTAMLPLECAPLPRILRDNGYSTAAFGKWHMTPDGQQGPAGPLGRWPTGWGFDYFYGFLGGDSGQWDPCLAENQKIIGTPAEYYDRGEPLLPARRDGRQDHRVAARGPRPGRAQAVLRVLLHRLQPRPASRRLGVGGQVQGSVRPGLGPAAGGGFRQGSSSSEWCPRTPSSPRVTMRSRPGTRFLPRLQAYYARQMEVYAGFSENADHNVGRVIDAIDELGELDNTLIVWIWGDNGASMEGTITGSFNEMTMQNGIPLTDEMQLQLAERYGGTESWGGPIMDPHYSAAWAWAGNTPFKWGKQVGSHLGGTRNPMVLHWPERILDPGGLRSQFTHVTDVAATILDVAGIPAPSRVDGVEQEPLHGVSFADSLIDAAAPERHTQQYFETMGNRAMYKDGWWLAMKTPRIPWVVTPEALKPYAPDVWDPDADPAELYYLPDDFAQAHDLAAEHPEKVRELKDLFWREAERYKVLPLLATLSAFFGITPPLEADREDRVPR